MAVSKAIEEEIGANRRVIARLKREIFGVDKTHKSRYIKEFLSEFRNFRSIVPADTVIEEASRRDIVYFGDYHPLEASQDWVLRLMRELSARGRKVVLALEMLHVHQQDSLDRWMKGTIGEEQFLDAIDYRSEWGFDWRSYRRIFELAKDPFIPIFGIDSEHRDHLKYIRRRDRLAARRIGTIRKFFPEHLILVVIGESHLASGHLPAEVRAELGGRGREIVIVQNIDEIYWRLLRRGRENAEAVKIDKSRYCVFTAFPMHKYQAYRDIIDVWTEDEEVDAATPFLHETIEEIYAFLAKKGRRPLIALANGRRETIEAVLPEVQGRATYHALSAYMRSRKIGPREITAILENLKIDGMRYVSSINALLVVKNDPSRMVREAARFVLHLMRGEIMERRGKRLSAEDEFYGTAIAEALVCFAAKVVNPSMNCVGDDALPGSLDARGAWRTSGSGTGIPNLGVKKRLLAARTLGARLGEALHLSFHEGRVTKERIAELFAARLDTPGSSRGLYLGLVGNTRGRGAARRNGSK
jgi:hypothetical protein